MNPPGFQWDVYSQNCPTRAVLERIANKWVLLILGMLDGAPARFNQLKRGADGISQKVLTQTLRALERDGLITRTVLSTSPAQVEYEATALGLTLARAADPIRRWAELHMDEVLDARQTFDTAWGRR